MHNLKRGFSAAISAVKKTVILEIIHFGMQKIKTSHMNSGWFLKLLIKLIIIYNLDFEIPTVYPPTCLPSSNKCLKGTAVNCTCFYNGLLEITFLVPLTKNFLSWDLCKVDDIASIKDVLLPSSNKVFAVKSDFLIHTIPCR